MDKPPYKVTIKLTSARPDAIGEALTRLRELGAEHDRLGDAAATITFEDWKEAPIAAIREQFEIWLHRHQIAIECEVTTKQPGLRPETVTRLRAEQRTPMDEIEGFVNRYGVERVEFRKAGED